MSEIKVDDKVKAVSYFSRHTIANGKSVYKLTDMTNDKGSSEETTYFLETTNNVISNETTQMSKSANNNAANMTNKESAESNENSNSLAVCAAPSATSTSRDGVPKFNLFIKELRKLKKTDPKLRRNLCFNYFS